MTLTNPPKNDTPDKALVEQCDWPEGGRFAFHDEPGEHDPCYVVMPDGAALPLNHHAGEGVDIARAQFIIAACNAAQHGGLVDARWRPEVVAFADLMEQQLRANDHKPGWKSDTAIELARRLNQESDELWGVLNEMDPGRAQAGDAVLPEQYRELSEQAGREAADVANFAMMIADVCGALPSTLASNSPVVGEDAPDTFWMIERNDGEGWLSSLRGATSRDPLRCLQFDSTEEALSARRSLPWSKQLQFKVDPTEHKWADKIKPAFDQILNKPTPTDTADLMDTIAADHIAARTGEVKRRPYSEFRAEVMDKVAADRREAVAKAVKERLRGDYTDAGMEDAFFRWPVVEAAILDASCPGADR